MSVYILQFLVSFVTQVIWNFILIDQKYWLIIRDKFFLNWKDNYGTLRSHDFSYCYFKIKYVCHGCILYILRATQPESRKQNRAVIFGHLLNRSTPATLAAGHAQTEGRIITIKAGWRGHGESGERKRDGETPPVATPSPNHSLNVHKQVSSL